MDKPYLVIYLTKEEFFFRNDFASYAEAKSRMEELKKRDYIDRVILTLIQEEWVREGS